MKMKQVRVAAHCVTDAAENNGPMIFARIGRSNSTPHASRIIGESESSRGTSHEHRNACATPGGCGQWFEENDSQGEVQR
jgi:hypothetical protein